ncbi:potassium channel family protein [Shewanella violacea]|uniref:Ion channel protein n=2 Tax=Shewanella violacea TaxID=60217 RepID=D4ZFX4_SHEVD|nr:ion channel protein [Shewanella violacea DSS12]
MTKKINQENNFYYMTCALIGLLVSSSLVEVMPSGILEYALEGVIGVTFLICILSLRFDHRWKRFMQVLALCWVIASVLRLVLGIQEIDLLVLLIMFAFFWGTFKSISRQILFTGSVDGNKVVGSVALFLLIGLMWTIAYLLIMEFAPNSFTGMGPLPWGENFSQMAYFSFVTLTTLGYGDISPISSFSQVVVYMEAIAGVFYMAIVVASLVSSNQGKKHG